MTRTLAGLCAATALGFVATLGAQAPAQTPSTPAQPPASSSAAGSEVKVTGCLAKQGTDFVLTNAMVEAPTPSATGTAGTTGAAGSAAASIPTNIKSATAFKVQGTGLDTHVGQRVELTGAAMAPSSSSSSSSSSGSSGGGAAGAAAGAAKEAGGAAADAAKQGAAAATGQLPPNAPTLTAKSVRMVAEKC